MKYNISHDVNKIILINLILATSQHYPRSSSFTSCCTHRSVPVLSFNFLTRGQTHQQAMSQSFCQYTTKQISCTSKVVEPERGVFSSENSHQLLSLEQPHTHEGSCGHAHVLKGGQRQHLAQTIQQITKLDSHHMLRMKKATLRIIPES